MKNTNSDHQHSENVAIEAIYTKHIQRVAENPDHLRSKVWLILELPNSSAVGKYFHTFMTSLVFLSIFIFFAESVVSFQTLGEQSKLCSMVVKEYCFDKFNSALDPGCFLALSNTTKLRFGCENLDCFGKGSNFGSNSSNLTCSSSVLPFQSKFMLVSAYGEKGSPNERQRAEDVCKRLECAGFDGYTEILHGNQFFIPVQFFLSIIFTVEFVLRLWVKDELIEIWYDSMVLIDFLSIVPFYCCIILSTVNYESFGPQGLDFSILPTSPITSNIMPLRALEVIRLVKITRHYSETKILMKTAEKSWRPLFGCISFFLFIVLIFSFVLHEIEKGILCTSFLSEKSVFLIYQTAQF